MRITIKDKLRMCEKKLIKKDIIKMIKNKEVINNWKYYLWKGKVVYINYILSLPFFF